jgi:hypothetical protein
VYARVSLQSKAAQGLFLRDQEYDTLTSLWDNISTSLRSTSTPTLPPPSMHFKRRYGRESLPGSLVCKACSSLDRMNSPKGSAVFRHSIERHCHTLNVLAYAACNHSSIVASLRHTLYIMHDIRQVATQAQHG